MRILEFLIVTMQQKGYHRIFNKISKLCFRYTGVQQTFTALLHHLYPPAGRNSHYPPFYNRVARI